MYSEELKAYIEPAAAKVDFMKKSPLRYFLAAVFAGLLAGLGAKFTYIVGSILHETVFYKKICEETLIRAKHPCLLTTDYIFYFSYR